MEFGRPLSGDELREQLRAETLLADLEWMEDVAKLHDSERVEVVRRAFAKQFRDVIGVEPDKRILLRHGLETILNGGGQSVVNVISSLRPRD